MSAGEYALLALSSLFVIMDPIATVPTFLAITPGNTPQQRRDMARFACIIAGCVLLAFALAGKFIFKLLGITIPAFQLAGSIVLLLIALDMLQARRSRVQETEAEKTAGAEKDDIAITPLAVPMLAGPGAISTVIMLYSRAENFLHHFLLVFCIVAVCVASYAILAFASHGSKWLNPIAMRLMHRLMGLLLAAIGMQFLLNALAAVGLIKP